MKLKHLAIVYCFLVLFALLWNITACTKKEPIEEPKTEIVELPSTDTIFISTFESDVSMYYKYNRVCSTVFYDESKHIRECTLYVSYDARIIFIGKVLYDDDAKIIGYYYYETEYANDYRK